MGAFLKLGIIAVVVGTKTGRNVLFWSGIVIARGVQLAKRTYDDI